jgi:hypothetical protein
MFNYKMLKESLNRLPPVPNTAIIAGIYYDGMTLLFPGDTQPSQKHYRGLAGVMYKVGQTVQITKISGTYLVGLPLMDYVAPGTCLYNVGDTCTAITGGWDGSITDDSSYWAFGIGALNSGNMFLSGASASVATIRYRMTKNAIDFSEFSKLIIESDIGGVGSAVTGGHVHIKSSIAYSSNLLGCANADGTGRKVRTYDVSGLSSGYVFVFGTYESSTLYMSQTIYKIWLEK